MLGPSYNCDNLSSRLLEGMLEGLLSSDDCADRPVPLNRATDALTRPISSLHSTPNRSCVFEKA